MRNIVRRFVSMQAVNIGQGAGKRPWRDAASLIIAAPTKDKINGSKYHSDYDILFLKRIAKSSFFPNAYVYPGGVLDPADKNPRWSEIFQKVDPKFCDNVRKDFFVYQDDGNRSPLFPGDTEELIKGILPNEIAFRICAIRETFEESGLLLLTNDVQTRRKEPKSVQTSSVTHLLPSDDIESWRTKVHNDADQFMNLCIKLNRVPDIWSLKEWSEWLTPVGFKGSRKRYDTVFYSCCLKEKPQYSVHDKVEMSESIWITPAEIFRRYLTEDMFLAPPQILETLKLLNFSTLENLSKYMYERAMKGMRRSMPHFTTTKDGQVIELLPGDIQYPRPINELGLKEKGLGSLNQTYEEIRNSKNRYCLLASGEPAEKLASVKCNVELDYGQVGPVTITDIGELGLTSKL